MTPNNTWPTFRHDLYQLAPSQLLLLDSTTLSRSQGGRRFLTGLSGGLWPPVPLAQNSLPFPLCFKQIWNGGFPLFSSISGFVLFILFLLSGELKAKYWFEIFCIDRNSHNCSFVSEHCFHYVPEVFFLILYSTDLTCFTSLKTTILYWGSSLCAVHVYIMWDMLCVYCAVI